MTQSYRMFANYSKEEVIDLFEASMSSLIVELWITQDSIKRNISWTNVIIKKQ